MIMTLKKRKGQKKTPTETSVQFQSFLNSDATWMRIPWKPERFKTVDSMRATYISSAGYHGILSKISIKAFDDSILLMKKGDENMDRTLETMFKGFKNDVMNAVTR